MYGFYFARCMNIIFNSLLAKYDVHKTRKMKSIHAICYQILLYSAYRWEWHHIYKLWCSCRQWGTH